MNKDKSYYITGVKSLRVGDEYCYLPLDKKFHPDNWIKDVVSFKTDFESLLRLSGNMRLVMKMLDEDDVCDLGFKKVNKKNRFYSSVFSKDKYKLYYNKQKYGCPKIMIKKGNKINFRGEVMNKSVLKTILKSI